MGWLFLLWVVICGTIMWPIGRWSTQHDGSAKALGFWTSLPAALISTLLLIAWEKHLWVWQVWLAGAVMGVAFAVGFCALIMHCLKIGPAGPTVTINNMAMVCGVLYGLL